MSQLDQFYEKLKEDRQHCRFNAVSMDKAKYQHLINKVKSVKTKAKKEANEYKFLKRYDVLEINGTNKLIFPTKDTDNVKYFVYDEELFGVLNEAHGFTNHGGRDRMMKHLRNTYKNVTYRDVQTFLNFCEPCQQRQRCKNRNSIAKPMQFAQVNSRCQVDFVDFQARPDGDYRFIMNYQDHLSKFVILKPLKSRRVDEVCGNIIEIFTLFGAPSVLLADDGKAFVDRITDLLKEFWPDFKIVYGKPDHTVGQDVETMIVTWMQTNNTSSWSQGLKFVQLMKNSSLHDDLKRTPFEAMFGCLPKHGLSSSNIPRETLELIHSQKDLEDVIGSIHTLENGVDAAADLEEEVKGVKRLTGKGSSSVSVEVETLKQFFDCSNDIEKYKCMACARFHSNCLMSLRHHLRNRHRNKMKTANRKQMAKCRQN